MIKSAHPYIIDVEASGFGAGSYPIEVGLALEPGKRFCRLIRPAGHWRHWDEEAEAVHRISRATLLEHGRPVTEVARELNELLDGRIVFSDAWAVDKPWIIELFAAAGMRQRFSISALETILTEEQMGLWSRTRNTVVRELGLERHRASNDSRIIQETFLRLRRGTATA